MADISNSKMVLAKNFLFWKLYVILWNNSRKILKNIEKIPTGPESVKNSIKTQKYSNKLFYWLKNAGKFPKKLPEIPH